VSTTLAYQQYLEAVGAETARLTTVALDRLAETVPSCPEWTVHDLVDHLRHVYTFWHTQLLNGDTTARVELDDRSLPEGSDPSDALEEAAHELGQLLAAKSPDAPCWNWSGRNLTAGWLARRMALESAVHRYDAELAAGTPTPIGAPLSVDGIDEFLTVHLATDLPEMPDASLGGPICLACSDTDNAWTVEIGGGKIRVRDGRGPAVAYLSGTASALFLFVWNRVTPDDLELTGDRGVAYAWAKL
jgi:uncharacterized protein (TIGR03083 family)